MPSVYLAGAIERAPDSGKGWRELITPTLTEAGITVFDPNKIEPKGMSEEELAFVRRKDLSTPENILRYQQIVAEKIIQPDLQMVRTATIIICNWDEYTQRGAGTAGEVTYAKCLGIPVYTFSLHLEKIPGWVIGCSERIYDNLHTLIQEVVNAAATQGHANVHS